MKKILSLILTALLVISCTAALAETVTMDGSVVNVDPVPLTFSASGTIATLPVTEGAHVNAGDTVATLKTTGVYAKEDGTVHLFGEIGDSTEMVSERYGAVAYIEPATVYTISASTSGCFNDEANRIIHPGEKIYINGISDKTLTGSGYVTSVSGKSYSIELQTHENITTNKTVYIYRNETFEAESRVGKGTIARADYTAYTGEGIITSFCVKEGDSVKKGDLLFETITADYTGTSGQAAVLVPEAGIIAESTLTVGSAVNSGDTLCTLYPDRALRVKVVVNEEGLSSLAVGTPVSVAFTYVSDDKNEIPGTVEMISALGVADESGESEESQFSVIIALEDTTGVSYGMTVTATVE